MADSRAELIDSLTQIVRRVCPHAERIFLFGSRARGDARPRSDIDLAVDCPQATPSEWLGLCNAIEDADTLLSIDLVRLDTAPSTLRSAILREGKLLYERRADHASL